MCVYERVSLFVRQPPPLSPLPVIRRTHTLSGKRMALWHYDRLTRVIANTHAEMAPNLRASTTPQCPLRPPPPSLSPFLFPYPLSPHPRRPLPRHIKTHLMPSLMGYSARELEFTHTRKFNDMHICRVLLCDGCLSTCLRFLLGQDYTSLFSP